MKTISLSLVAIPSLLCCTAIAKLNEYYGHQAAGLPPDGTATFASANLHPNVSNTVNFTSFYDSKPSWTWTVSVSDVYYPNASKSSSLPGVNDVSDPHVAYTTFSFSWPEAGNLNQALAAEYHNEYQIYLFLTGMIPRNVSDAWDPSQGSSCISALGKDCVDAMYSAIANGRLSGPDIGNVCYGSLWGYPQSAIGYDAVPFGNANMPNNATALQKNATFSYSLSNLYASGNTTIFEGEANYLQMIMVTSGDGSQLLCNRAATPTSAATPNARIGVMMLLVALCACLLV